MQPMRRFAFDAAIVFADILLLPLALGQDVWFETGEGPRLGPLPRLSDLEGQVDASIERLGRGRGDPEAGARDPRAG